MQKHSPISSFVGVMSVMALTMNGEMKNGELGGGVGVVYVRR